MCYRITLLSALFYCILLLLLDGNSFMSSLLYAGILPGSNMVCCSVKISRNYTADIISSKDRTLVGIIMYFCELWFPSHAPGNAS